MAALFLAIKALKYFIWKFKSEQTEEFTYTIFVEYFITFEAYILAHTTYLHELLKYVQTDGLCASLTNILLPISIFQA